MKVTMHASQVKHHHAARLERQPSVLRMCQEASPASQAKRL